MKTLIRLAALSLGLLAAVPSPAAAQGSSLVVGPAVLVREKAYTGAQAELIAIPWIEGRVGRFSFRGLQASYDLASSGPLRLAATGSFRLGGVDPEDLEPRLDLFDRDPTVELGLAASVPIRSWRVGAEVAADVLGEHGGWDGALRVSRMVRTGRLVLVPAAAVRYWSPALARFEYGLEPGEAGFAEGYEPGSAVTPEVTLAGSWTLGPKWSIVGFARAARLSDGIVDSPIVDGDTETMGGVGLAYRIR